MEIRKDTNCHVLVKYDGPFIKDTNRFRWNSQIIKISELKNAEIYFLNMPRGTQGLSSSSQIIQLFAERMHTIKVNNI